MHAGAAPQASKVSSASFHVQLLNLSNCRSSWFQALNLWIILQPMKIKRIEMLAK
jgi:hypothetical protein